MIHDFIIYLYILDLFLFLMRIFQKIYISSKNIFFYLFNFNLSLIMRIYLF